MTSRRPFRQLMAEVRGCRICEGLLPLGPRPVLQLHPDARLLIASQAPGRRVHGSGIPFQDPSGVRLRDWLGIGEDVFYDSRRVAILPMGFCYPGTGTSGDHPPRPECAPAWRRPLLERLSRLRLTLVVGRYAMLYHLGDGMRGTVTETVRGWRDCWPEILPLPHPSPRNQAWLTRNTWFERDVLPALKDRVRWILDLS